MRVVCGMFLKAWEAVNERDVMGTPIVLIMKFSPQNGVWILLDAEEKDVGRLSDWVAKALGGEDYSGKTEYMVVIEPGEING